MPSGSYSHSTVQGDSKIVYKNLVKQKAKSEKKVLINIIVQFILIIFGLSFIYGFNSIFTTFLKEWLKLDDSATKLIIPFALVYLFIELGFTMAQFFMINKQLNIVDYEITNSFYTQFEDKIDKDLLRASLKPLNIVGQLPGGNTTDIGRGQTFTARFIIFIIIIANHFTVFTLISKIAYDRPICKICLLLIAFNIFIVFHYMYMKSNRRHNYYSPKIPTELIAWSGIVFSTCYIVYTLLF